MAFKFMHVFVVHQNVFSAIFWFVVVLEFGHVAHMLHKIQEKHKVSHTSVLPITDFFPNNDLDNDDAIIKQAQLKSNIYIMTYPD